MCLVAASPVFARNSVDDAVVDDVYGLASLFFEQQYRFLPISPPSEKVFVQSYDIAVPVDWKHFPKALTKEMYAQMDAHGFPVYKILVYEDPVTRETVFLNSYGIEVYRLAPESGYDPYAWQEKTFGLQSRKVLDGWQRWIFDPAHIAVDFTAVVPELFYQDYLATQQAEPLMTTLDSGPPPPGTNSPPGGGTSSNINLQVTMTFDLTEGFGAYLELYGRQSLVSGDWELLDDWIPTYGSNQVEWLDVASSNKSCYFYQYFDATADADMDGHSDAREERDGTDPEVFNDVDSDGDGMHDWWELKLFGNLNENLLGDFDGDGLANGTELVWYPDNRIVMYSDPSLYDTDGEGLGDGVEHQANTNPRSSDTDGDSRDDALELLTLHTDPNNPDIVSPVASLD